MYDENVHVGVAVIIGDPLGHVLFMKRSLKVSHGAGLWSVPGGWVDFGETLEEAGAREVKEEVGIDLRPQDLALSDVVTNTYDDIGHVVCVFYSANLPKGAVPHIMEADKCDSLKWGVFADFDLDKEVFPPIRSYIRKWMRL